MSFDSDTKVLAIGIDAAEPALVRQLIDAGEMPVLQSLLKQGKWLRVESPAHIGSGSVWPTFITGEEPSTHGVYGEWSWHPDTMGLSRYSGRHLKPFWKGLIKQGIRVGILDVPFAPFIGFTDGFELSEWGPHDLLEGRLQFAPESINDIVNHVEPHPLLSDRLDSDGPADYRGLKHLISECLHGVKLRGTLAARLMKQTDPHFAAIVFTEIHHSGHYLWHTIEPGHSLYDQIGFNNLPEITPGLKDIYREVDQQIGNLLDMAGTSATVMVFSLHGMRPTHGVPAFLEPLLCELGYARLAGWTEQSWIERAIAMMAAVKRRLPNSLRKLYYNTFSPATTLRLAKPTMMPAYDWEHTRAFPLPADQHGWVHVNLVGREAKGTVSADEYDRVCQELEETLLTLNASDGRPIVREVFRSARNVQDALVQRIPDLIVHWEDAAFSAPLRIQAPAIEAQPVGRKFSGRHRRDGFCIFKGQADLCNGEVMRAAEMHEVITRSLREVNTGPTRARVPTLA